MLRRIARIAHLPGRALLCAASCVVFLASCGDSPPNIKTDTEYQAVLLTNGHLFFGKLERGDRGYLILRDVFYFQSQVNPETKQVTNTLLKRGREFHGPAVMYLNAEHVVIIESVSPDSQVAKAIKQAQQPTAAPPTAEK
jgi:hypothetical protein